MRRSPFLGREVEMRRSPRVMCQKYSVHITSKAEGLQRQRGFVGVRYTVGEMNAIPHFLRQNQPRGGIPLHTTWPAKCLMIPRTTSNLAAYKQLQDTSTAPQLQHHGISLLVRRF
ncbi:hypothetical protein SLE2022_367650 [Rubroshorea leprosula]